MPLLLPPSPTDSYGSSPNGFNSVLPPMPPSKRRTQSVKSAKKPSPNKVTLKNVKPKTPTPKSPKEKCQYPSSPCLGATRVAVYEHARTCKTISHKKCLEEKAEAKAAAKNVKPGPKTKKSRHCATDKGVSRLTKRRLCSYISTHPSYVFEGRVLKKDWTEPPKQEMDAIMGTFFTPKTIKEYIGGHIPDYARLLYLVRYFGDEITMFTVPGSFEETKLLWSNEDPETDAILPSPTLQITEDLKAFLKKNKNKKYVFAVMRLYMKHEDGDSSTHANFLAFDMKNKIVYRYEPSGLGLYDVFDMDSLDEAMIDWAKDVKFKYEAPWETCPRQMLGKVAGIQRLAYDKKFLEKDPGGFCKVWSLFMLEQKMRNPDMSFDKLHDNVVKHFRETNVDMTEFGRQFSTRVINTADEILSRHGFKGTGKDDAEEYVEKHWNSIMKMATRK